jgi:ATP-dependent DNA helicase RecQ
MARPLLNLSIDQLEALFDEHRGDERKLKQLADELQHRSSHKARELSKRVRDTLDKPAQAGPKRNVTTATKRAAPTEVENSLVSPTSDGHDPPTCPKCNGPMLLRTAGRGRNAGGQFWGCRAYPACKGTRDHGAEVGPSHGHGSNEPFDHMGGVGSSATHADLPVIWPAVANRPGWVSEFVAVGAVPGIFVREADQDRLSQRCLSQCLLQSRRERPRHGTQHERLVSALVAKFLQRGRSPLPTLQVEESLLTSFGLADSVTELSQGTEELGWELRSGTALSLTAQTVVRSCTSKDAFVLDPALDTGEGGILETDEERRFLLQWVPEQLGVSAGHWFIPQAPLDALLEAAGRETTGARRIDFLFAHPNGPALAIEVDGPEHSSPTDDSRDDELASVGIQTIRILNDEMRAGEGPNLAAIRAHCTKILELSEVDETTSKGSDLTISCSDSAKTQFAIARAVGYGWLSADTTWSLSIRGAGPGAKAAVLDLLRLLSMFDALYGGESTPNRCDLTIDGESTESLVRTPAGEWVTTPEQNADASQSLVLVMDHGSPCAAIPGSEEADLTIRPAFLPVELSGEHVYESDRPEVVGNDEVVDDALRIALRQVFRKKDFRPMQSDALRQTLRQQDSVVLLPTGAGKSLIYQLAGLLMPGVTLVVDPIVALIEDQVEGLAAYGIDRAAPIASSLSSPEEKRQLLVRVERGEYQFVLHSPERLQAPAFRSALRALAETSIINLAVIDEAHCVSEWGHDFRPAYLNLARNLRRLGADKAGNPPPLLALTGTASRAVLRDVLTELDIDRSRSDAVIRPISFDRSELEFDIVKTSPREDGLAALRGVMNGLPARFGLPRTDFYRVAGRDTASGIIFVPTVNARIHGVRDAVEAVRTATSTDVVIFSGSAPRGFDARSWEARKRENAKAFKRNASPALVATKAFGMGIDKPNIRYTVHFGIPSSLESLYQEAGRAGRDRRPAQCVVIFSEFDEKRSDRLLDPRIDLLALRALFDETANDRSTGDDITRALFFHLQAYEGAQSELGEVEQVLARLGDLGASNRCEIPFPGENGKGTEKAILRLLKVGVVDDYEVEFGSRKYIVHSNPFDLEVCKGMLRDYVEAAQPALTRTFTRILEQIQQGSAQELALQLAGCFIQFTYDIIERSRRRMIQECVLLSRQAKNDEEIRARLLDYLQEGIGKESLDRLLEDLDVNLETWCELLDHVQTAVDANELRASCGRALESYPSHPGLLLIRGVAEALCSDSDDKVVVQGIESAVTTAVTNYGLSKEQVETSLKSLFTLAGTRGRELGPPLVLAVLNLCESIAWLEPEAVMTHAGDLDDDRVGAVVATWRVERLSNKLQAITELACTHFEPLSR